MDRQDPAIFGRNVRAFRMLRGWSIRDLATRAGVSTRTIVKIERGQGCTSRTEQKIALGFGAYVGRLWDASLLSDRLQRVIRKEEGRWFFADVEDAAKYHHRLTKGQIVAADERLRSDPDEIQEEAERHRLGWAGLSRGFVKAMGGGIAPGYYQYNQCEMFGRDFTLPDGFNYCYVCYCARGGIRMRIREETFELREGDSIVFEGGDAYWIEPLSQIRPPALPSLIHFTCLGVLALPSMKSAPQDPRPSPSEQTGSAATAMPQHDEAKQPC